MNTYQDDREPKDMLEQFAMIAPLFEDDDINSWTPEDETQLQAWLHRSRRQKAWAWTKFYASEINYFLRRLLGLDESFPF
jgi:hypothetical protein